MSFFKKFTAFICLAAFLFTAAGCSREGINALPDFDVASLPGPEAPCFYQGNFLEDNGPDAERAEALAATAKFLSFAAEIRNLDEAFAINPPHGFEASVIEDENFTIDVIFPSVNSLILNTMARELIFDHQAAFAEINTEGYFFARPQIFSQNPRFFSLAVEFRSFGDYSGFSAFKQVINYDILKGQHISLADVFESGTDFMTALTNLAGQDLYGLELFNFDETNIYLHTNPQNAVTLTIPVADLGKIWRGGKIIGNGSYVALTFDDGPNNVFTTAILDALLERNVHATFFLLGSQVERFPDVVARMHQEGHLIGNHSISHAMLTQLSRNQVFNELFNTNSEIEAITGGRPSVFRPPYGIKNDMVLEVARELNMSVILWSVDPQDWRNRDAFYIRDHVLSRVNDGSVILLHDLWQSSVDATIMILDALIERGYNFVTVEELFLRNATVLEAGQVYHSTYRSVRRD